MASKVAVLISGEPRISAITTAFAHSLCGCDSVDWYVHFWSSSQDHRVHAQWRELSDPQWVKRKFQQNLPSGHALVSYHSSDIPHIDVEGVRAHHCDPPRVVAQWWGWRKVWQLAEPFADRYTWLVKGRVDLPVKGKIDCSQLDPRAVNIARGVWDPGVTEEPPDRRVRVQFADPIFVGRAALMRTAMNIVQDWATVRLADQFHPDLAMAQYLDRCAVPVTRNYWDTGLNYPAPWAGWID